MVSIYWSNIICFFARGVLHGADHHHIILTPSNMIAAALSTKMISLSFISFHLLIILSFAAGWQDGCDAEARPDGRCDAPSASSDAPATVEHPNIKYEVPSVNAKYPNCRLFLAESTIPNGRRLIIA